MSVILQDDGLNGFFWIDWASEITGNLQCVLMQDINGAVTFKEQTWSTITEATFDGYARQTLNLDSYVDASSGTSDIRTVNLLPVTFSGGAITSNIIRYWGILFFPSLQLCVLEALAAPYTMMGGGNSITITPSLQYSSP